jgi:hypothetical protein
VDNPSALTAAGLIFDIAGALILALGLVLKTPQAALDEATPRWGFNAVLDASLAAQSADAQVGAGALVLGFALQTGTALGWQERSWTSTAIAVIVAIVCVASAWLFLLRWLRPHRIRELLAARLAASETGIWWPVLAAYGRILKTPFRGEPETIAQYAERLLGSRRFAAAVGTRGLPDVLTKPRSELAGTAEYEAAHGSADEGT